MAAMEDGIIPDTPESHSSLRDELWRYINPGVPEDQNGATVQQQAQAIFYVANKFGLKTVLAPVRSVRSEDKATACVTVTDEDFPFDYGHIDHVTVAVDLGAVIGPSLAGAHHFMIRRKDDTGEAQSLTLSVLDSCKDVDGGTDSYAVANVLEGARELFEPDSASLSPDTQFGNAWTWTKA